MTRREKITALQAIKEGNATIKSLHPPQRFIFIEQDQSPGLYLMAGKEYTVDQYFAFCKGNENDTIISITKHQPSRIKGNLTLNIE